LSAINKTAQFRVTSLAIGSGVIRKNETRISQIFTD
jgi:hypothetical protein